MNGIIDPPFLAPFMVGQWFIALNALIVTATGLLLSGWWRLSLFIFALVGLELSGLIGARLKFMWAHAKWFRIYLAVAMLALVTVTSTYLATKDDEIFWMGIGLWLILPIFFLIPISRFTKTLLFPP